MKRWRTPTAGGRWASCTTTGTGRGGDGASPPRRARPPTPSPPAPPPPPRQYDQAVAQCQKVMRGEPNYWWAFINLAWAYEQKGMYPEAITQFEKSLKEWPDSSLALAGLAQDRKSVV